MPTIDLKVFEFIDDIVVEARGGEPARSDSAFFTFGEAFFDQFFGALGHSIRGFNSDARKRVLRFVDSLPATQPVAEIRRVVVSFEEFADLKREARGNYDGHVVDFDEVVALLSRILIAAQAWAVQQPAGSTASALSTAIAEAAVKVEALQ